MGGLNLRNNNHMNDDGLSLLKPRKQSSSGPCIVVSPFICLHSASRVCQDLSRTGANPFQSSALLSFARSNAGLNLAKDRKHEVQRISAEGA